MIIALSQQILQGRRSRHEARKGTLRSQLRNRLRRTKERRRERVSRGSKFRVFGRVKLSRWLWKKRLLGRCLKRVRGERGVAVRSFERGIGRFAGGRRMSVMDSCNHWLSGLVLKPMPARSIELFDLCTFKTIMQLMQNTFYE